MPAWLKRIFEDLHNTLHRKEDKPAALLWLLREVVGPGAPTIVFASTRHHVEFLHTLLSAAGVACACVYGAMDQVKISNSNFLVFYT